MRVLIESDSLIQFIIATHITTTIFKNDEVDLIMYDSMPAARRIYENIKKTGIYSNVYILTSVLAIGRTKLSKKKKIEKDLKWLEMITFPERGIKHSIDFDNCFYDIFVFCANGIFLDGLFNVCKKKNRNIKCYRYEGSLTSYLHDHENKKGKIRNTVESVVKRIFKNYDITDYVEKYYFFEPDLIQFEHHYCLERLPKISSMREDVRKALNEIFEFKPELDVIGEKVIAFEDGNLFYLNNEEEVDLYKNIGSICKNDFVIKLHPRRTEDRFNRFGIKTNKSIAPWEIYLLNQSMDGKILLTTASGSVFTTMLYFGQKVDIFILYKCINAKIPLLTKDFARLIEIIDDKIPGCTIHTPISSTDLQKQINQVLKNS